MASIARAHDVFDRFGIVPTYVVDYPVATDPEAVAQLAELRRSGRAEIGTHLHPWVTPPYVEAVTRTNSYHCNLPADLERAKIVAATDAVEAAFGERPTVFKAGRYGFGANTARVIAELGYRVDCSVVPHSDFRTDGGPDFRGRPDQPFWIDRPGGLLEVPLTVGFFGAVAAIGPALGRLWDSPGAERLRIPGLLGRSGLVGRSRLTPEGVTAAARRRFDHASAIRRTCCGKRGGGRAVAVAFICRQRA